MKAGLKRAKAKSELPLTVGKLYDVLDLEMDKKRRQIAKIKVKNDLGKNRWYKADKFKLFYESQISPNNSTAEAIAQSAAQSATPDGRQMIIGIDLAAGQDITVNATRQQAEEIGKQLLRGIADGFGLEYGA